MKLELFKNNEFGAVRVLADEKGEPLFVAKDVCDILGLSDVSMSLKKLDEDEKLIQKLFVSGQYRNIWLINESGFYSLVLRSNKSQAKKFKKWVTSEVLPAIRKYGVYATPNTLEEIISNPEFGIKLLQKLKQEREEKAKLKEKVIELKPKAFFAEVVNNSENLILVREFAKLISRDNFSIGERKLYEWLRNQDYLMKDNQPYQKYVDMGIFKVVESAKTTSKGTSIYKTTKITGKGQVYLQKKIYEYFKITKGA